MDIIAQITSELIDNLLKAEKNFVESGYDTTSMHINVRDICLNAGTKFISAIYERLDESIRDSEERKRDWNVVRADEKSLLTSLGEIRFKKTLYSKRNSESDGEKSNAYLLDHVLGLLPHQYVMVDAEAEILKEAVQSSYSKSGKDCGLNTGVSGQTVLNVIHSLEFPEDQYDGEKKTIDYLYIEADEDHISLQFNKKKGDLKRKGCAKTNTIEGKLVYLYEGIDKSNPKRHKLINPHYFSGTFEGREAIEDLWDEIYEYIDSHYEISKIKKIYLNGDGGAWIKAGKDRISDVEYVLDGFHIEKAIVKMSSDQINKDDIKAALRDSIHDNDKELFSSLGKALVESVEKESAVQRVSQNMIYILNNWPAIQLRMANGVGIIGCSAEGHVSHVLSSRMSSRPLAWSRVGADKMIRLRAYHFNNGNMLELVKYSHERAKLALIERECDFDNEPLSATKTPKADGVKKKDSKYADLWYRDVGEIIRKANFYKGICNAVNI